MTCHCMLMRIALRSVNDSSVYCLSGLSVFLSLNSILVMAKMFKFCSMNGALQASCTNLLLLHLSCTNVLSCSGYLSVGGLGNRWRLKYCGIRDGCLFHISCIVDVSCWYLLSHNCRSSILRHLMGRCNSTSFNCRKRLVQST
jgi:hypothetical protein